jgi:endoglucanase
VLTSLRLASSRLARLVLAVTTAAAVLASPPPAIGDQTNSLASQLGTGIETDLPESGSLLDIFKRRLFLSVVPRVSRKEPFSIAVSGNHLVNASDGVVTLHGVDVASTAWQCLYGQVSEAPIDEASIAAIAAWHVNAVRIPLNEDCWLGINGAPTNVAAYHEALRNYIYSLQAHGLYVILDLHWAAPGNIISHWGVGFSGYFEMADEDHSPAFWESIASYFKNDHALLFDLFNEPGNISWRCWREGCTAPKGYQTAGMQQLIDVIRATGATQPVMVGGLEGAALAGQEWLNNRPTDPAKQLVASVHVYDLDLVNHYNSNIGVVAEKFPVVVGELGETDCADYTLNAFLPWADAHGVSYVAWAWFTGQCASFPSLISSYNGTPTPYGIAYREHLLANFPAPSR